MAEAAAESSPEFGEGAALTSVHRGDLEQTRAAPARSARFRDETPYELLASRYALGDPRRYGWRAYSHTVFQNAWDEVAQLVPPGATKVLEVGCGGGEFAAVLRHRRPDLRYLGLDSCRASIDVAMQRFRGVDGYGFVCGDFGPLFLGKGAAEDDVAESDGGAAASWDFVVSIGCVFLHGTAAPSFTGPLPLLDAIASSSRHGFLLLCQGAEHRHGICMEAARQRLEEYAARARRERESSDGAPEVFWYASPADNRGRKPCLRKLRYHRLLMFLAGSK